MNEWRIRERVCFIFDSILRSMVVSAPLDVTQRDDVVRQKQKSCIIRVKNSDI